MREIFTRAIVLGRNDSGEMDGRVSLFSEGYGKIVARAKSLRKITSKLSGHLQPLIFVKVRLIKLSGVGERYAIIDCIQDDEMIGLETGKKHNLLSLMDFLSSFAFEGQKDKQLWEFLVDVFKNGTSKEEVFKKMIVILGIDSLSAECFLCHKKMISGWIENDHSFVCKNCSLKIGRDKVRYI